MTSPVPETRVWTRFLRPGSGPGFSGPGPRNRPVVTVMKPEGSIHLCIDPHIDVKKFTLPKAEHLFARLQGAKVLTVSDAAAPVLQTGAPLALFGRFKFSQRRSGIRHLTLVIAGALRKRCGAELTGPLPNRGALGLRVGPAADGWLWAVGAGPCNEVKNST